MADKHPFYQELEISIHKREINLEPAILEIILQYLFFLWSENQKYNLTGYINAQEYIDYHLLDTLIIIQNLALSQNSTVTDVGAGAGIPGIILKIMRQDLCLYLIDSSKKKIAFLNQVIDKFQLKDCRTLCERAEIIAQKPEYREKSDLVTARALASIPESLELTAGFVGIGKKLILPCGYQQKYTEKEKHTAEAVGCSLESQIEYTLPQRDHKFQLLIFKKISPTPKKYPRKPGQIKKRPL